MTNVNSNAVEDFFLISKGIPGGTGSAYGKIEKKKKFLKKNEYFPIKTLERMS